MENIWQAPISPMACSGWTNLLDPEGRRMMEVLCCNMLRKYYLTLENSSHHCRYRIPMNGVKAQIYVVGSGERGVGAKRKAKFSKAPVLGDFFI